MTAVDALEYAGVAFIIAITADCFSRRSPEGSTSRFVLERFVAHPMGLLTVAFFFRALWLTVF